jgi:hypothetical protein
MHTFYINFFKRHRSENREHTILFTTHSCYGGRKLNSLPFLLRSRFYSQICVREHYVVLRHACQMCRKLARWLLFLFNWAVPAFFRNKNGMLKCTMVFTLLEIMQGLCHTQNTHFGICGIFNKANNEGMAFIHIETPNQKYSISKSC